MEDFLANLKYAIRNRETVTLGGGEFSPTELKAVADALETAQAQAAALNEISEMLSSHPDADVGNSKVHYCLVLARNALMKI